jgi:hypothetical protein
MQNSKVPYLLVQVTPTTYGWITFVNSFLGAPFIYSAFLVDIIIVHTYTIDLISMKLRLAVSSCQLMLREN